MNPLLAIAAAASLLVPAAAYGLTLLPDDADAFPSQASAAPSSGGNLEIVLMHVGDDARATLSLEAPGFRGEREVVLREAKPFVLALAVTPGEVRVGLEALTFRGWNSADLGECDDAGMRFIFETKNKEGLTPVDGESGIRVLEPECIGSAVEPDAAPPVGEPQRFAGTQTIGLAAAAPWPTCPTSCTFQYTLRGSGGLDVPVHEGATRVDVFARWTPRAPTTEELLVGLFVQDDACGSNCWMGVAGGEGAREVAFSYEDPAAVKHKVSAMLSGPGAGIDQDISFEVLVHYS